MRRCFDVKNLDKHKKCDILKMKRNERAFNLVTLKTAQGHFVSDVVFSCIVYYSLLFYSFFAYKIPLFILNFQFEKGLFCFII